GTRADFARALRRYRRGNLCNCHELCACAVTVADGRNDKNGCACACRLLLFRGATSHRSDVLQRETQCGSARKKACPTGCQRPTQLAGEWHGIKRGWEHRWKQGGGGGLLATAAVRADLRAAKAAVTTSLSGGELLATPADLSK